MCSCRDALMVLLRVVSLAALLVAGSAHAQTQTSAYAGIGRTATAAEIAAWDIDVRTDFKGLPAGSGSVAKGQEVWESRCASCHGIFGESIQFFTPLIGGTTAADIASGRVASLRDGNFPGGRTTFMKLASLSTLWDYIRRAMPWAQPKSLSNDEVYAVTAYLLNLAGVVGDDFALSDRNMAAVQARLPNRAGMTLDHAMWPGKSLGTPARPRPDAQVDARASACMRDCKVDVKIATFIPDRARNDHGNLAQQNRGVGAQLGIDTRPAASGLAATPAATAVATAPDAVLALLRQHNCTACHGVEQGIVGPALRDVAAKHAARSDASAYFASRITGGSAGQWGQIAMPAQNLPAADAQAIANWLAGKP